MLFSVVIPTYNRIEMLERVLDALSEQSGAPDFEVVVINDGARDETEAVLEAAMNSGRYPYPWRFETQPNGGPGKARNRGISLARGRYIVLIGDDTVPEPDFLAEHARTHLESGNDRLTAVLGYTGWPAAGRVTPFMEFINDYGLQFGYKLIKHGDVVPFNFFYTSNISLSRELLVESPFDVSFPSAAWEDIELAYRLDRIGLKIHYNAKAVTRHHHEMTVDSFARRQYGVGKAGAIFSSKHPELRHFLGVQELQDRPLASRLQMMLLRVAAKMGERFRPLARADAFERLMRQHYLRGLRDGLVQLDES